MNIRKSMYYILSILIIVPFLLFSLLISYIYSIKLENIITDSLHSVANSQISEMTDFCTQQMKNLTIMGHLDVSQAALREELDEDTLQYLNNMLASQVQLTNYLISSAIIDSDLRVIACSEDGYDTYANKGIISVIEKMDEQQFYISDVMEYKKNGKTHKSVVSICKIKENSETLGYVLAEINLDFYNNIREHAKLWNESTFYLLDGQKRIISAGTPEDERNSFVTTAEEREDYTRKYNSIDFEKNPQGSFSYKIDGENYITYYSEVQFTDWQIMLTVNLENYLAQRTIYGTLAFFLTLLCAALGICIGAFTSKRIVHPIGRISDTLNNIQQKQDYSLRIKVERKDELGNLSIEINQLLDFIETENLYKSQQQRLLQKKAEQDALTKVLNKEKINQYLEYSISRHHADHSPMAVLFVDIDDFKAFNTNYGHTVGDQVLLFITSLLIQETKGTVGRIGGDEFLIVVETPESMDNLEQCLERINELSLSRFVIRESSIHTPVSCCIGAVIIDFANCQDHCPSLGQIVNIADTAMYQVKNNGKQGYAIFHYESQL